MGRNVEEKCGQRRNIEKKQVLKYSKTRNQHNYTKTQMKEPFPWAGIHIGHKYCIPESVVDTMKTPWWLQTNESFGVKINPDWKPGAILKGAAAVMEQAKAGMKYPGDILHPERAKRKNYETEENRSPKEPPQIQVLGENRKPGYISKGTREVMERAKAGIIYFGDRLHPERAKRKIPDEYQKLREANEYQSRNKDKNQCLETKPKKVLLVNENVAMKVLQPETEKPKPNKSNKSKKMVDTKSAPTGKGKGEGAPASTRSNKEKKGIQLGPGNNVQPDKSSKMTELLPKNKRSDIKRLPKKEKR